MVTKVLVAISIIAALTLILVVFSAPGGGYSSSTATDETLVERASRTRLNTEPNRSTQSETDETFLERATRTRASSLIERAETEL